MKNSLMIAAGVALAALLVIFAGCMPTEVATTADSTADSPDEARAASAAPADEKQLVQAGETLFEENCKGCHLSGMGGAPDLTGVTSRLSREQFGETVEHGRGNMPSWTQLSEAQRDGLWAFLSTATASNELVAQTEGEGGGCGCAARRKAKQAAAEADQPDEGGGCPGSGECTSGCCNTH